MGKVSLSVYYAVRLYQSLPDSNSNFLLRISYCEQFLCIYTLLVCSKLLFDFQFQINGNTRFIIRLICLKNRVDSSVESTLIFERYACGFAMLWVWETKKEFSVEAELFVYGTGGG